MHSFTPTLPQDEFIFSDAAFPGFVGGFGSGKSEALIVRAIRQIFRYPDNDFGFYEPSYDLIRRIAWPRFEDFLTQMKWPFRLYKHPDNVLEVKGRGKLIFRSMEIPERIVGYEVADSFVDELDTLKHEKAAHAWRQIIARNRQKKADGAPNTAAVATTPEGFKFVYEQWELKKTAGYELIRAPTRSNPHLPDGYIDSLKGSYPEHLLDAYLEGHFVNLNSGSVYGSFDRERCNSTEEINGKEPLLIGMDFNVEHMSAVVHVRRKHPVAVAELVDLFDTPAMIDAIQEKYKGHTIAVYPDASGNSRKSLDASKTDLALLRDAGFAVVANKKNPSIRDRVNSMNKAFEDGYTVNTAQCPHYTRCLEQQTYDKNGVPEKQNDLDHLNDAGGYFIAKEMPIIKPVTHVNIGMAM